MSWHTSHFTAAAQELTGLELSALIEDPEHASVRVIAAEALARSDTTAGGSRAVTRAEPAWARWVAPAPFTVKMRLFCLPYAGGVSENVFARCARMQTVRVPDSCTRPSEAAHLEVCQQLTGDKPDNVLITPCKA